MKTIFLILGMILVIIVLGALLALGYFGLTPFAKIFGSDKPRDLGISYTAEDYKTADEKAKVKIIVSEGQVSDKESIVCKGAKEVKSSFSDKELTAVINEHQNNWKYYPVSNVQLRIGDDGFAQISGILRLNRLQGYANATGIPLSNIQVFDKFKMFANIPFYAEGTAGVLNNKVNLNLNKMELGRITIPSSAFSENREAISSFLSSHLQVYQGLTIRSLAFDKGQMSFDGTLPESIETYK